MEQVPCEFQADQPNFIFQLAAPDVIWHIYSIQRCFKGVLGMDLPSSGDVAVTMGQVPCECGMVPSTCHLQGRYSFVWGRSPVSLLKIIPSIEVATPGVFARAPDP